MRTDDANPAVVVAHQSVPLEIVGEARRAIRLTKWADHLVHRVKERSGEGGVWVVSGVLERVLRPTHGGQSDGVVGSVIRATGDVDVRRVSADRGVADVAHRCGSPRLIEEGGHVRNAAGDALVRA